MAVIVGPGLRNAQIISPDITTRTGIFGATVLINLLALAIPLAMLQLFQRIIPNQSFETLQALFVILCGIVIADTALKLARSALMAHAGEQGEAALAARVIDRVFHGSTEKLQDVGSETLTEQILSMSRLQNAWNGRRHILITDMVFAGAFLALVWVLAGILVLVPLIMIGVVSAVAQRQRPHQLRAISEIERNDGQRMSFLIEVLQNIRLLKMLNAEQRILRKYDSLHQRAADANEVLVKGADRAFTTTALLGQATTGVTSLLGAWLVIRDQINLAELATSILLTGRAVLPFVAWAFARAGNDHGDRQQDQLFALLEIEVAQRAEDAHIGDNRVLHCADLIARVPHGVDIHIGDISVPSPGIVTVVGQRGAPAGPVLRTLAGLSVAARGKVQFRTGGKKGAPACVFVPVETDLLQGTLLDNLIDFRGRGVIARRIPWLDHLGLGRELQQIPAGLQTPFAGNGKTPGSPGFFKKLGLATGFGRRAPIMILEDPFANLDPASAKALSDAIVKLSCEATLIVSGAGPELEALATMRITLFPDGPPTVALQRTNPDHQADITGAEAAG